MENIELLRSEFPDLVVALDPVNKSPGNAQVAACNCKSGADTEASLASTASTKCSPYPRCKVEALAVPPAASSRPLPPTPSSADAPEALAAPPAASNRLLPTASSPRCFRDGSPPLFGCERSSIDNDINEDSEQKAELRERRVETVAILPPAWMVSVHCALLLALLSARSVSFFLHDQVKKDADQVPQSLASGW